MQGRIGEIVYVILYRDKENSCPHASANCMMFFQLRMNSQFDWEIQMENRIKQIGMELYSWKPLWT